MPIGFMSFDGIHRNILHHFYYNSSLSDGHHARDNSIYTVAVVHKSVLICLTSNFSLLNSCGKTIIITTKFSIIITVVIVVMAIVILKSIG